MNKIMQINLPDAKEVLRRGLKWAVGEDAVWKPEYDEIADWLTDNKRKGLLCCGGSGLGKTLICNDIMQNIFIYYLRKNYIVYSSYDMKDNIEQMKSGCPFMIDDIGAEPTTNNYGVRQESFTEIVYNAELRGTLMVLTTNLLPQQLIARYGQRTFDRLSLLVRPVVFKGESMRK